MRDDYCTAFPDKVEGIEIGQTCCKKHDNMVGERGTYNPFTPHIEFYKCLRGQGISLPMRSLITFGGWFFSWIKYPYFVYKIYMYRKAYDEAHELNEKSK